MFRERSDQAHGCHGLVDPLVLRKSVATYLGSWSVSPILRHNRTGVFHRCEVLILVDQAIQDCFHGTASVQPAPRLGAASLDMFGHVGRRRGRPLDVGRTT